MQPSQPAAAASSSSAASDSALEGLQSLSLHNSNMSVPASSSGIVADLAAQQAVQLSSPSDEEAAYPNPFAFDSSNTSLSDSPVQYQYSDFAPSQMTNESLQQQQQQMNQSLYAHHYAFSPLTFMQQPQLQMASPYAQQPQSQHHSRSLRHSLAAMPQQQQIHHANMQFHSLVDPGFMQPIDPPAAHKLFVGQVPRAIVEADLRRLFEPFGEIVELQILREKSTGASRGCAFLTFLNRQSALDAIGHLHEKISLYNRPLVVRFAGPVNAPHLQETKIFVGQLSRATDEQRLQTIFSEFGQVNEMSVNQSMYCRLMLHGVVWNRSWAIQFM